MKHKLLILRNCKILLPVLGCLLMVLFAGCGSDKPADSVTQGYSVTDEFGYKLQFSEKPKHILGTTGNIEEVLIELIPPDRIVAISEQNLNREYSLIADKAAKVKKVIPDRASIETIIAQHPDLVFMQIRSNQAMAETLSEMGIKVFRMKTPVTLEMIRNRIRDMSIAVGEPERGKELLKELDAKIALVKKHTGKIPKEKRKTVIGYTSLGASGSATGVFQQICEEAGVINGGAATGIVHFEKISDEQIIKVNPDIFVVTDEGAANEYGKALARKILADEALKDVKAVANKRFIYLKSRYKYSNSQHFGDAVMFIARGAYPELFEDEKDTNVKVQ